VEQPRHTRLLDLIGVVATVEGLRGVVQGAAQVPDAGAFGANVDNELRFYSAWYATFGLLLLGTRTRPPVARELERAAAVGFGLAATGRLLSTRRHGRPHPTQLALLAAEVVLPALLLRRDRRP